MVSGPGARQTPGQGKRSGKTADFWLSRPHKGRGRVPLQLQI